MIPLLPSVLVFALMYLLLAGFRLWSNYFVSIYFCFVRKGKKNSIFLSFDILMTNELVILQNFSKKKKKNNNERKRERERFFFFSKFLNFLTTLCWLICKKFWCIGLISILTWWLLSRFRLPIGSFLKLNFFFFILKRGLEGWHDDSFLGFSSQNPFVKYFPIFTIS